MAHLVSKAGFLTFDTEEAELKSTMLDTLTFVIAILFTSTLHGIPETYNREKKLNLRFFCIIFNGF